MKFTGTRSSTAADFWWDTKDTEIAGYCSHIKNLAESLGIQHLYVVSEDSMSFTSSCIGNTMEDLKQFNTAMDESIPRMREKRAAYFLENQHTLTIEFLNSDGEHELRIV